MGGMRKLRLLAVLLAPAIIASPLACEDSSSSSGGTFNPEAGPGFETGPRDEAGPLREAGLEVSVPPVKKGLTVTVLDRAAPVPGIRIILHDAAGAVIGDMKTDMAGKVAVPTAPSMVTVMTELQSKGTVVYPVTYLGVADGDNLVVNQSDDRVPPAAAGQYNVSFGAAFPTATSYLVRVSDDCANETTNPSSPMLVDLNASCFAPQAAVLATARSGSGDIGFGFVKNLAKPAAIAAPQAVGPISLTAAGITSVRGTNLPVGFTSPTAELLAIANNLGFSFEAADGTLAGSGIIFSTATGFAESYQASARATVPGASGSDNNLAMIRRETTTAPASATLTLDFATALPAITSATANNATAGRPTVTLASASPLSMGDAMIVTVTFQNFAWRFVAPTTGATFQVPAVPADSGIFLPSGSASVPSVIVAESSLIAGYEEIKKLQISPALGVLLDSSRALPAAGTVRVVSWTTD